MKYLIRVAALTAALTCMAIVAHAAGQKAEIRKSVFTFNTEYGLKLYKYETAADPSQIRPAVIFAFGGGFTHGTPDEPGYRPYFEFLARQGYVVLSVQYRTELAKCKPAAEGGQLQGFVKALTNAVSVATTDYLTATGYILRHAEEWKIDPTKIVATGSSAGAITTIEAEYAIVTGRAKGLPEGFNYAAMVTFAGALYAEGAPVAINNFCPIMMFQGDADQRVPYYSLTFGNLGMYGSHYIAEQLKANGRPGTLYTVQGADHSMATTPMTQNLYDIAGFLNHVLSGGSNEFVWTTVTIPGKVAGTDEMSLRDFILNNMPKSAR